MLCVTGPVLACLIKPKEQNLQTLYLTETMSQSKRQYDIVLLGATGYTGKLVSEYISKALPTNLSWAIAGRSQQKLDGIANDLRTQYPDRKEPGKRQVLEMTQ